MRDFAIAKSFICELPAPCVFGGLLHTTSLGPFHTRSRSRLSPLIKNGMAPIADGETMVSIILIYLDHPCHACVFVSFIYTAI